jgi:hypothetical protein
LLDVAELLLQGGARTDDPSIVQSVAIAAEGGNEAMVALLVKYGLDLNLACFGYRTKMHVLEFVQGFANKERTSALLVKYGAQWPCDGGAKRSATEAFDDDSSEEKSAKHSEADAEESSKDESAKHSEDESAEEASGGGGKRSRTEAALQQDSVISATKKGSAAEEGGASPFSKCADNCTKRRRRR